MKRLHIHLGVEDLARSIDFYSALFDSAPSLLKHDYAKWQIDDPRVNFTITKRARAAGLDHLGIQVEDGAELAEITQRLAGFGAELVEQKDTRCCYARSDKAWAKDPQGISWETFLTHATEAGDEGETTAPATCGPADDCGDLAAAGQAESCCAATSCGTPVTTAGDRAACCA